MARKYIQPESFIGKEIICHETGLKFIGAADGCTTNYARDSAGNLFSDAGVDIAQKRELLDRSKPFVAYISSDGKHLTGWKGNILGSVISRHAITLTRRSLWHGKEYSAMQIRDIHGGLWYGRGSPGLCITIRPYKAKVKA